MSYDYKPLFGEPISPWVRVFAWRPVRTEDYGWRWLRMVYKRRCQSHTYLSGPMMTWWQYIVSAPKQPTNKT